jgi:hypothetical protein
VFVRPESMLVRFCVAFGLGHGVNAHWRRAQS